MKKTTVGEMIANAISHGIGLILAIIGFVILLIKSNTGLEYISSMVFGISMILFHSFPEKMKKTYTVFQRLDHSSIFLLITGTYTPFLILVVDTPVGYILLGCLWITSIVGIVFKSIWIHKFKYLHLMTYLIMGWSVIFVFNDFVSNIGNFTFVAIGGVSYTVGVIFYVSKFKYSHFVWHIFVLLGTFFHFLTILNIL